MHAASRAAEIAAALRDVSARVAAASTRAGRSSPPRFVAVSKTKPADDVAAAYAAGHRVFGENYVQELVDKAPTLPSDVAWHFIGHLQSNKAKTLVDKVPGLACVETVDTPKLASKLDAAVADAGRERLRVLVQVNTSGEPSKHGVEPAAAPELAKHVAFACPNLTLAGVMTIGMPDYSSRPENFECLTRVRSAIAAEVGVDASSLELSMGMSGDYEAAIEMGSTNVRVGSGVFGARVYA